MQTLNSHNRTVFLFIAMTYNVWLKLILLAEITQENKEVFEITLKNHRFKIHVSFANEQGAIIPLEDFYLLQKVNFLMHATGC